MEWLAALAHGSLLVLVVIIQLAGIAMLLVGLPGTWVVLGSVIVYGLLTGWEAVGLTLVLALLILAVLGEVLEFFASAVGARRFGASKGATVTAIVAVIPGAILGSMVLPIIGTIVGALAGAFLGASLWELAHQRPGPDAWRAGFGALLGRSGAVVAKVLIALTMSGTFLVSLFRATFA